MINVGVVHIPPPPGSSPSHALHLPLDEHPNPEHSSRRSSVIRRPLVLGNWASDLLLQSVGLPPDADVHRVYSFCARSHPEAEPFVRALWFRPDSLPENTQFLRSLQALALRSEQLFGSCCPSHVSSEQTHSGGYVELGAGVMPGRGRESVNVAGTSRYLPFSINHALSDDLEPLIASVMTSAAAVAHSTLPSQLVYSTQARQTYLRRHVPDLQAVLQYPRPYTQHERMLSSHQVVLRGTAVNSNMSQAQRERAYLYDVSDLHVDRWDGNRGSSLGSCTLYYCITRPEGTLEESVLRELGHAHHTALRFRDQAVFTPMADGDTVYRGRGVRVAVMQPGWVTLLFTRTDTCPHSGISAVAECPQPLLSLPSELLCGRILSYALSPIDQLLEACTGIDATAQDSVLNAMDERLRRRAH